MRSKGQYVFPKTEKISDKKIINKMLPEKTIKDIVDHFKDRNIPKRTIYNYCLEKKNEH